MYAPTVPPTAPPRRRLTAGKVILLLFLLLILLAFWYIARSGLVPVLAKLVGADKPVDLGVTSSAAQATSVVQKLGIKLDSPPAATNPAGYRKQYTGQVKINQEISESEVSALLNYNHVSYWAVKDAQVKIHGDGTVEAALVVRTSELTIRRDGDVPTGIMRYLPAVLPDQLPVYVKGRLDVVGPQQVSMDFQSIQIGRVNVPSSVVNGDAESRATQYVNDRLRNIPGLSIQAISYQDGKVHFKGTWPKEFRRIPIQ